MENKRGIGSQYESFAAQHLKKKGYEILQHNYRCCYGEVDLVARHRKYLVFVEVKYRKNSQTGMPVEAVNVKKQKVISKVAQQYMMFHGYYEDTPVRFDVVSILNNEIVIYENAFDFRE